MTNYIWITTQKEMFHKYENAFEEVKFLRNLHRHLFKFKVYIEVNNNDRDIEFFMFKKCVNNILDKLNNLMDENKSCEQISHNLNQNLIKFYPNRKIKIEVSEDGENGSLYNYPINQ